MPFMSECQNGCQHRWHKKQGIAVFGTPFVYCTANAVCRIAEVIKTDALRTEAFDK